jgi:hypothetical protein
MTHHTTQAKLTKFDLMVIRSGGRTQAEFEVMVKSGFGFNAGSKVCTYLAAALCLVVAKLGAGANRGTESSHLRLEAKNVLDSQ